MVPTLNKIPKSKKKIKSSLPKKTRVASSKMLFSFELLDFSNEYYNCNGMCDKGIKNCFEKMKAYCQYTIDEIYSGRGGDVIRFHPIRKGEVSEWPTYFRDNEELEESFYQISFGKSKGRAHGIIIDNIFYVIWLDPHHFLYHNKKYGPKRAFTEVEDCCNPRDDIIQCYESQINELKDKIQKQNDTIESLNYMIDKCTSPPNR